MQMLAKLIGDMKCICICGGVLPNGEAKIMSTYQNKPIINIKAWGFYKEI